MTVADLSHRSEYASCARCGITRRVHTAREASVCRACKGEDKPPMNIEWMDRAACRGIDPEAWFPAGEGQDNGWRFAIKICGSCPVRSECLEYAIERDERFGIWGGLTAHQRGPLVAARRYGNGGTPCP